MTHPELRWNPELQEWFGVRCGLVSDHITHEDAWTELALFECHLTAVSMGNDQPERD